MSIVLAGMILFQLSEKLHCMMKTSLLSFSLCVATSALLISCTGNDKNTPQPGKDAQEKAPAKEWKKPKNLQYHFQPSKDWVKRLKETPDSAGKYIILSVNRVDLDHVRSLDSLLVPDDLSGDRETYMPFPLEADGLKDIEKIVFFSYPAQAFAAYSYGHLVHAGPTSMGSKSHPTPEGLYFTNWKAEETISTFDDEWVLRWNFNIENKEGIGWHQYALPGYPASHSCLRLLESDAKQLYDWADQWKLKGTDSVLLKGTPVIVFGKYPFDGPKPWLALAQDAHALDIKAGELESLVNPHRQDIMAAQEKRAATPKEDAAAQKKG
jgi:hypothetical protein